MSWWWSRRESGSPYEHADHLYDESVNLSHTTGNEALATEKALAAVQLLREMLPNLRGNEGKRRLAKALWRHSTMTAAHDPAAALATGREGVQLAKDVLDATRPEQAAFEPVLRELVIAMNDLAQASASAGFQSERLALLLEARTIAERGCGVAARQALGTTVHNLAQHKLEQLSDPTMLSREASVIKPAIELAEQAVAIRSELCAGAHVEKYYRWELASSRGQLGRALFLLSGNKEERDRGLQLLARAPETLQDLDDASSNTLRQQLVQDLEYLSELQLEFEPVPDALGLGIALRPQAACLLKLACLLEPSDRTQDLLRLWFPDHMRAERNQVSPRSYDLALRELTGHGLVMLTGCETAIVVERALEERVRRWVPRNEYEQFARVRAQLWLERFQADLVTLAPQTVSAGIAASVYARRFGAYVMAFDLLESHVLRAACRTGEATPVLLHLQLIASDSGERALIERCEARALWLAGAHCHEGKLDEALITFEHGIRFSRQHAFAPVSSATWHVQRMEFLRLMGRHVEVLEALDEALTLVEQAQSASDRHALREQALGSASAAASGLGNWEHALTLNRRRVDSLRERAASPAEIARARLNDSAALVELGDYVAADELLRTCEETLQGDDNALAQVLGERAVLASRRGEHDAALRFKRQYLQLNYRLNIWRSVAHGHEIYGNELARSTIQTREASAHFVAAALVNRLLGDRSAATRALGRIKRVGATVPVPRDLQELIYLVERTPELSFGQYLAETQANVSALMTEILQDLNRREP